jgi:hypothetical protein
VIIGGRRKAVGALQKSAETFHLLTVVFEKDEKQNRGERSLHPRISIFECHVTSMLVTLISAALLKSTART